jgi:hypothetical protein
MRARGVLEYRRMETKTRTHIRRRRALAALGVPLGLALALGPASAVADAAVPTRIAYVAGLATTHPTVHVARADGSGSVLLGPGEDVVLSPDAASAGIVTPYTRKGITLVVRPATGGPARLLAAASQSISPPVWSSDAKLLAVVLNDTRLVVIDPATGATRTIAKGQIQGVSFSPQSDRLVYARSKSLQLSAPVNVFVAATDGSGVHAITHDGRSLYPLWGPRAIACSHERLRRNDAPVYQLRLLQPDGSGVRQLTHMRIPPLVSGLTATTFSDDGMRLLAEFGGQDTSEAWTVNVTSGHARDLTGRVDGVIGTGLSGDGRTVLVQRGYFDDPRHQSVATIPFGGGRATVLVPHGSEPTWGG